VRFRSIAHLVSIEAYGETLPATKWLRVNKRVLGVSDWPGFTLPFARSFDYTNAQFDRAEYPDDVFLDLVNPNADLIERADIVTCSDVLEHIPPPAQRAFDGLFRLLKPGGAAIITVPYGFQQTVEHFPDLWEWELRDKDGQRVLVNRTPSGSLQVFDDLIFHGGGDFVLEMRLFGLTDLTENLRRAGFEQITVMSDDVPEYGIYLEPWSRPIVARRPI
jgi:SAM-dependent methyltransferase